MHSPVPLVLGSCDAEMLRSLGMSPERPGGDDEDACALPQRSPGSPATRKVLAPSLGVQQGKAVLSGSGELSLILWI